MKTYEKQQEWTSSPLSVLGSSARSFSRGSANKAALIGLGLLIVYAALRGLLGAMSKAFWHDELCTWIMAHQPSLAALWKALQNAADGNPPGFYLIERAVAQFVPNEEIAFRLPSLLGFCCVLLCLFVFIRRRSSDLVALGCTALLFLTDLVGFTAEARPYSLLVACVAIAAVSYQRAPAISWMLLMASALALSESLHYYALFMLVPFAVAEAALLIKTRRVRWTVWIALALGALPFLAFWPLLSRFGSYMSAHFWSKPSLEAALDSYGDFLHIPSALGIAIFVVAVVAVWTSCSEHLRGEKEPAGSFHEYVFALALLCLPLVEFVATRLAHGGMNTRYALPAVLAIPIIASYILPHLRPRAIVFAVAFLVSAIAFQESAFWRSHPGKFRSPARS
jgi:hypothetical protein